MCPHHEFDHPYFDQVAATCGPKKLICVIKYLAEHKFYGSTSFITRITDGASFTDEELDQIDIDIEQDLRTDFTFKELVNAHCLQQGLIEHDLPNLAAYVFWVKRLANYLCIPTKNAGYSPGDEGQYSPAFFVREVIRHAERRILYLA